MGVRGPQPQKEALRRTGWRPSCVLPGQYQDLVFAILQRPEFEGKTTKDVVAAALAAYATNDEAKVLEPLK